MKFEILDPEDHKNDILLDHFGLTIEKINL